MSDKDNNPEFGALERRKGEVVRSFNARDIDIKALRVFPALASSRLFEEEEEPEISLRDLLSAFFRHKWKMLVIFLILSTLAVLYVASSRPAFQSEAKVYIRSDREGMTLDATAGSDSFLRGTGSGGVQARSEVALLASVTLAERVVDMLGVEKVNEILSPEPSVGYHLDPEADGVDSAPMQAISGPIQRFSRSVVQRVNEYFHLNPPEYTPYEAAVQGILGGLEVAPSQAGSNVLVLTYTAARPESAQALLNHILSAYLQLHISTHKSPIESDFFRSRSEEIRLELEAREDALDERLKELNITSIENEKQLLLDQISRLDARIQDTGAEISTSRARSEALRNALNRSTADRAGAEIPVAAGPEATRIKERIVELRIQELELRNRYTDNSRPLQEIRNQIRELEAMLSGESATAGPVMSAADPALAGLTLQHETEQALLQGLTARENRLKSEKERITRELARLASHEKELAELVRQVQIAENEYQQYLRSIQVSEIAESLDRNSVGNVSIVQSATKPMFPLRSPRKTMALLAFGIFAALGSALGFAFLLEYFDHSLRTAESVEKRLDLPVLASIPLTKHPKPEFGEDVA